MDRDSRLHPVHERSTVGGLHSKPAYPLFAGMPQAVPTAKDPISRLRAIVHVLRSPGGCPWDQEQSHESLIPNLIEEAYETAAAIRSGDASQMEEELGDYLLQVVFHAELASESGAFDFDGICEVICEKLIRRHPHVFAESAVKTTDGVLRQWDEIKAAEKGAAAEAARCLDDVGQEFPALLRAREIQKKAAKVGFDWDESHEVLAKVREEVDEVAAELANAENHGRIGEEIGDLLFAVVNLARKEGLDAESLLAAANDKFIDRFHRMETALERCGKPLQEASLEEMEEAWQKVKLEI